MSISTTNSFKVYYLTKKLWIPVLTLGQINILNKFMENPDEKFVGEFLSVEDQKKLLRHGIELGMHAGTVPAAFRDVSDKRLNSVLESFKKRQGEGIKV